MKNQKAILMILFIIGVVSQLKGQTQMINNWIQNYQHTSSAGFSNEGRFVGNDAAGNIYITADITSDIDPSGNFVTTTQHYAGIFKFDAFGNPVNNRLIGTGDHIASGFDNLSIYGMHVDAAGNVYVGYNVFDPVTNYNASIVKYNSSLIRLWTHTFNASSIDLGIGLSVAPNGKTFAAVKSNNLGSIQYHIIAADTTALTNSTPLYSFDPIIEYLKYIQADDTDIYVTGGQLLNNVSSILTAKVSYSGALKWKRLYNAGSPTRNDIGNKIIFSSGQAIYVVGTSDRGTPYGNDGVVLNYYKGNGRLAWVSPLDFNNAIERGVDISMIDPAKLFAVSTSGNTLTIDRLDALRGYITGRIQFTPTPDEPFTTVDSVTVSGFQVSPDNNIYIGGTIYAKNPGNQPFAASFMRKYNPFTSRAPLTQAFKLDSYTFSSGSHQKSQWVSSFHVNFNTGKLHLLFSNAETFSTHSNESVQLQEFDITSPYRVSGEELNSDQFVHIYPNPAFDHLYIESKDNKSITITDVTGRLIQYENANPVTVPENSILKIDVSGLNPGVYFIRYREANDIEHNEKFIKK